MSNYAKHPFVSAKSDGGDATLVRPSNWNAGHDIGIQLTNRSGGTLVVGDVLALSAANDESAILGDTAASLQTYVVAQGTPANLAQGIFTQTGAVTVKVNAATTRGNYLQKSSGAKALEDTGVAAGANTPPPIGAVGIALTSAGGAGTVIGHLFGFTVGVGLGKKGADIASASSLTIPADVTYAHITGTTTVTAIATRPAGTVVFLEFDAALQLTHNATSFILLAGGNVTTVAGDVLAFVSEGSGNWRQIGPHTGWFTGPVFADSYVRIGGGSAAAAGALRLVNTGEIRGRNAANGADVIVASVDSSDRPRIGPGGAGNIRMDGQVRCDIDSAARLVLPVGADKWAV